MQELKSTSFWPVVENAIQVAFLLFVIISGEEDTGFLLKPFQAGIERANQRAISNVATIKRWTLLTRLPLTLRCYMLSVDNFYKAFAMDRNHEMLEYLLSK